LYCIVDESYRTVLRLTWKAKYGDIDYKQVNFWDLILGLLQIIIGFLVIIEGFGTLPRGKGKLFPKN